MLKETVESLEEIERLFTEGVREAGERTRTAGGATSTNEENMQDNESNIEMDLDIETNKENPSSEAVYGEPLATTSEKEFSKDSVPRGDESVNRKFSISEENSSDIRYSIDETPETPDVSENGDLTVSFCSNRESKWLIWSRRLKNIFRFRKIIFRNLLTNPPTWCIMMPMKEKTASAMDDPMED